MSAINFVSKKLKFKNAKPVAKAAQENKQTKGLVLQTEALESCYKLSGQIHVYICMYIKYIFFIYVYIRSLFANSKTYLEEKRLRTYHLEQPCSKAPVPGIHKTSTSGR